MFKIKIDELNRSASRHTDAFTLIECLVALTILGCVVVAVCYTTNTGQQQLYVSERMVASSRIAKQILDEISTCPAKGNNASRLQFGVTDYDGYTQPLGGLTDASGKLYPSNDQSFALSVTVRMQNIAAMVEEGHEIPGWLVTVRLTHVSGTYHELSRFIAMRAVAP